MVSTKILVIYLFFVIIFSFFYTSLTSDESQKFDARNYLVITKIRQSLDKTDNLISNILKVVLIPFILIDALIFIFVVVGFSFSVMPVYLDILFLTPMGIIIMFDYVLPYIRGN
jgi:hypothetical protein